MLAPKLVDRLGSVTIPDGTTYAEAVATLADPAFRPGEACMHCLDSMHAAGGGDSICQPTHTCFPPVAPSAADGGGWAWYHAYWAKENPEEYRKQRE